MTDWYSKPDSRLRIELLRPLYWIEVEQATVGATINLNLEELGAVGPADVLAIGPCSRIQQGAGHVVTGTFAHEASHQILNITVEGLDEPIGVTSSHPFWSETRQQFVPAGELEPGETLDTLTGTAKLTNITPRGPPKRVYNLEVHGQHVYRVTSSGVLVHNSYPPSGFSNPAFGNKVHRRFRNELARQTGTNIDEWVIRTAPGKTGVDATYIGSKHIGFKHAELKPRSWSGYYAYRNQLGRWKDSGHVKPRENTSLWFYNEQGVIGQSHLIE